MQLGVKDIWFRSELPLDEIAQRLGLQEVIEDAEDYWAWVIGRLGNVKLDITRTHTQPPALVETRIFEVNHEEMPESLIADLARRLQSFVPGAVLCGRWWYLAGHEFDLEVFQTFAPPDNTNKQ
jgi:hypothetical protein